MSIPDNIMIKAYQLLKSEAYHETYNQYLKKRIAEYEYRIGVSNLVQELSSYEWYTDSEWRFIRDLFSEIECKIVPKKYYTKATENNVPCFISNESDYPGYILDEVNFLIDCPLEIHLADILWTILVGPLLDAKLTDSCYANRIDDGVKGFESLVTAKKLFKFYPIQYSQWRDHAFSAIDSVVKRDNASIVSLDIQKCYYTIRIDWDYVTDLIAESYREDKNVMDTLIGLTDCIKNLYEVYWQKVNEIYALQTDAMYNGKPALPIGLSSSKVLCNFHLSKLDNKILETIRPEHYGRYVDDMLIVIRTPDPLLKKLGPVDAQVILKQFFIDTDILAVEDSSYSICHDQEIKLQREKICVFLVKKKQSKSVLDHFKSELLKNVSDLRMMPVDIDPGKLDRAFFGSSELSKPTKFRDLFTKPNNTTLLMKEISRMMMLAKSASYSDKKTRKIIKSIMTLFQGMNLLSNHLLWEKIATLMVLTGSRDALKLLTTTVNALINRVQVNSDNRLWTDINIASDKARTSLKEYYNVSCGMALSLTKLDETEFSNELPYDLARLIRSSCLMRSEHISYPLLEFTDYQGVLFSSLNKDININRPIDKHKIKFAPRYIHLHEFLLAFYRNQLYGKEPYDIDIDDRLNEFFGIKDESLFVSQKQESVESSLSIISSCISVRKHKTNGNKEPIKRNHVFTTKGKYHE